MWGYLLKRVSLAAGGLLVATFGAFVALRFIPGDMLTLLGAGRAFDPAQVAGWRLEYGLDRPIVVQYALYIRNILNGDLGVSYYTGRSVAETVMPALIATIRWQIPALLVAIAAALALALATARRRGRLLDSAITLLLLVGISLPEFATAAFLVSIFALQLGVLPVAGASSPAHFVLPALTMGLSQCAGLCRVLRSELQAVVHEDYVRTALAKGVGSSGVLARHVLPNAIGPFLTLAGIQIGRAIGGAFLIETIFNIPGLGRLAVLAVLQRDYPVILAVTIVMTSGIALVNIVVDCLQGVFNRRISVAA
jgi:ABC-type dipeptide/oligopeptide/nickel transport system permease component